MPSIIARHLTRRFGAITAVNDLSLTVDRGEIFGFLGPNGAGKTTTTRLLLDALRPTCGVARVLGGSGRDPEIRRRIGGRVIGGRRLRGRWRHGRRGRGALASRPPVVQLARRHRGRDPQCQRR